MGALSQHVPGYHLLSTKKLCIANCLNQQCRTVCDHCTITFGHAHACLQHRVMTVGAAALISVTATCCCSAAAPSQPTCADKDVTTQAAEQWRCPDGQVFNTEYAALGPPSHGLCCTVRPCKCCRLHSGVDCRSPTPFQTRFKTVQLPTV
jgi:hypothetical protein